MTRPTRIDVSATALLHNVRLIRRLAPGRKIIAMVKANAYGCGLSSVLPVLEGQVDAFGVASLEEALALRALGSRSDCILFQGVFSAEELPHLSNQRFQCVIHQANQLRWVLETPLKTPLTVWVKVNTGMHRLGFEPHQVADVIRALLDCPWIEDNIGLMTHLARADKPDDPFNQLQLDCFRALSVPVARFTRSIANSAAIFALPGALSDVVRPGIMLYGVSPFLDQTGSELGLIPAMRLLSSVSAIHQCPPNSPVGYGGIWQKETPSVIGVVPVGYGDGYPRHIQPSTPTWINGAIAPIVGRISMDMLTIDLTSCPGVQIGDVVELWGQHIPVEWIAKSAGTTGYELLCQTSPRVRPV